jgi:hypothetical protein
MKMVRLSALLLNNKISQIEDLSISFSSRNVSRIVNQGTEIDETSSTSGKTENKL